MPDAFATMNGRPRRRNQLLGPGMRQAAAGGVLSAGRRRNPGVAGQMPGQTPPIIPGQVIPTPSNARPGTGWRPWWTPPFVPAGNSWRPGPLGPTEPRPGGPGPGGGAGLPQLSARQRELVQQAFAGGGAYGTKSGPGEDAIRRAMRVGLAGGLRPGQVNQLLNPALYRGLNDPSGGGGLLRDMSAADLEQLIRQNRGAEGSGLNQWGGSTEAQRQVFENSPQVQAAYMQALGWSPERIAIAQQTGSDPGEDYQNSFYSNWLRNPANQVQTAAGLQNPVSVLANPGPMPAGGAAPTPVPTQPAPIAPGENMPTPVATQGISHDVSNINWQPGPNGTWVSRNGQWSMNAKGQVTRVGEPAGGTMQPTAQPQPMTQPTMAQPTMAQPNLPLDPTFEAQQRYANDALMASLSPLGPQADQIAAQLALARAREATQQGYDTQTLRENLNARGMLASSVLPDDLSRLATDYLRQDQDLAAQAAQAYGNIAQAASGAYGEYYRQIAEALLGLQQRSESNQYAPTPRRRRPNRRRRR